MEIIEKELPKTDIVNQNNICIDKIAVEYLANEMGAGEVTIIPIWRFYLAYEEYAGRDNPNLICAVNMLNGEFYYEERGYNF